MYRALLIWGILFIVLASLSSNVPNATAQGERYSSDVVVDVDLDGESSRTMVNILHINLEEKAKTIHLKIEYKASGKVSDISELFHWRTSSTGGEMLNIDVELSSSTINTGGRRISEISTPLYTVELGALQSYLVAFSFVQEGLVNGDGDRRVFYAQFTPPHTNESTFTVRFQNPGFFDPREIKFMGIIPSPEGVSQQGERTVYVWKAKDQIQPFFRVLQT